MLYLIFDPSSGFWGLEGSIEQSAVSHHVLQMIIVLGTMWVMLSWLVALYEVVVLFNTKPSPSEDHERLVEV